MKLELQDDKGSTGVFIEIPVAQLREELGLVSSSGEAEAQFKESQDKVGTLEEELKVALAGAKATMADFTPTEKAEFVINWAKGLAAKDKAFFAEAVGISVVAQVEEKPADQGDPHVIVGKTDKPGYKFYEHLNLSIKEA